MEIQPDEWYLSPVLISGYERHRNEIRAHAGFRLKGMKYAGHAGGHMPLSDRADEVIQDMWLEIYDKKHDWDENSGKTLLSYFQSHIDEVAKQNRRKSNRRAKKITLTSVEREKGLGLEFQRPLWSSKFASPEDAAIYADMLENLHSVNPIFADIAWLAFSGYNHREACAMLNLSPHKLRSCRLKIQELLEDYRLAPD